MKQSVSALKNVFTNGIIGQIAPRAIVGGGSTSFWRWNEGYRSICSTKLLSEHKNWPQDMSDLQSASLFKEKKATAIQFNWYETETNYKIEAQMLVGVDPDNIHLFLQDHQLIFETKSESKDQKAFTTDKETSIPVHQRSSLFLRQTIDIPRNVDEDSLVAKVSGNMITITLPKRRTNEIRKGIVLEDQNTYSGS
jgi:HSP20 family molecular chaperone IbpA